MVTSMTGFGQAECTMAGYRIGIDLKSVNHRYCEIVVRMPKEFARYENAVKAAIGQHVKRGRVDAYVTVERAGGTPQNVHIDWDLVLGYSAAAELLRERLSLQDSLTLRDLLSIPGLLITASSDVPEDEDGTEAALAGCAGEAAAALCAMRRREGAFLLGELEQRIAVLEEHRSAAAVLAPLVVRDYAEKLKQRIADLLQQPPDESRLAMEVALFADRASIDEELTRLNSHSVQFRELLRLEEPQGRRLDFLVQEMNREVNTIGSKANDARLSALVVEMKSELEKLREQIQNIE
ncbi:MULTISPECIES: YicC/YloC family endoribonuclease [Paenibacillus]|uniref:YicC/YloC family endoribonuclease n=1 Tax=Paenibacillus TaxID=44249 RepID=UPI0022B8763E|nr:YicC/YloC family endoribonuclease [Paenibacillus caseinilyticus]MCZ8520208.1 YicC family protein [Paenibacillus caseinilyticus]